MEISEKDRAEGWVEQLMVFTHCAHEAGKSEKPGILQVWLPVAKEQFDLAQRIPEKPQHCYSGLVKHVGPGQIYRMPFNTITGSARGSLSEYVGLHRNEEQRAEWRRINDDFEQRVEESKLAQKERKDDPLADHFEAIRMEYRKRVGGSKRAFMNRIMWEIFR